MLRNISICAGLGVLSVLLIAGCANPADNKTEAVVEEPTQDAAPATGGVRYALGQDSKIEFTGSKVTGSHVGGFRAFEGEIMLVDGTPEDSSVNVTIDATSLWSDNERLTGHLKSPDFFDVESFPQASFESTSIVKGEENYTVTGNLSLRGVEKSITFPADISIEDGKVSATAEFFIKRFDFNIEYKGKADDLIRDEVVIRLDLQGQPAA